MDSYSILGQDAPDNDQTVPLLNSGAKQDSVSMTAVPISLRFPGDDSGKSLAEMAQRDLEAALQLLAERAQYITGASGAAIALREGREMICRASAGSSAPELGAELQVNSGLTGESVRARQLLRCDDADSDSRVNRESCRALGIKSVMVMPLLRERDVIGVFELLADRTNAFEERDVTALERLTEMILTALEHADAAKRALDEIAAKHEPGLNEKVSGPETTTVNAKETTPAVAALQVSAQAPAPEATDPLSVLSTEVAKLRECQVCGFPVSEGRTICLDCEAARDSGQDPTPLSARGEAPAFLAHLAVTRREESWLQSHLYTIGTVVVAALTVALLWLRLR